MYYILDALRLKDKKEAHEYLSESMHFPEHYGKNLDALYDCLRELKDVFVWFTHAEEAKDTYFEKVYQTFREAAEDNRSFFVFDDEIQNRPITVLQGENFERLVKCMERAARGEELTIGFLGGSITQGAVVSKDEFMYAYRSYEWWVKNFPQATFHYVNGGIGGTSSHFGVARAQKDLLMYQPDVVVVDFSVNDVVDDDCPDPLLQETYEGLMRKILKAPSKPAVVALYNVFFDTGMTAEEMHMAVNKQYGISGASMKDSIYAQLQKGCIYRLAMSHDGLHPNDLGHEMVAYEVCRVFEVAKKEMEMRAEETTDGLLQFEGFAAESDAEGASEDTLYFSGSVNTSHSFVDDITPLTANMYENAVLHTITNTAPALHGFRADADEKKGHLDCFKNGWIGRKVGDKITFTIDCRCLAVQYRKTIHKPSPIARLVIDGDETNAVILDGNFDQTWGDCLYLERILHHDEQKTRVITIEIIEATKEDKNPFYLLALITA